MCDNGHHRGIRPQKSPSGVLGLGCATMSLSKLVFADLLAAVFGATNTTRCGNLTTSYLTCKPVLINPLPPGQTANVNGP